MACKVGSARGTRLINSDSTSREGNFGTGYLVVALIASVSEGGFSICVVAHTSVYEFCGNFMYHH